MYLQSPPVWLCINRCIVTSPIKLEGVGSAAILPPALTLVDKTVKTPVFEGPSASNKPLEFNVRTPPRLILPVMFTPAALLQLILLNVAVPAMDCALDPLKVTVPLLALKVPLLVKFPEMDRLDGEVSEPLAVIIKFEKVVEEEPPIVVEPDMIDTVLVDGVSVALLFKLPDKLRVLVPKSKVPLVKVNPFCTVRF